MITNPIVFCRSKRISVFLTLWERRWVSVLAAGVLSLSIGVCQAVEGKAFDALKMLEDSALLVVDEADAVTIQLRSDRPMVPASTVKLVTAWLALEHWGQNHRFQTSFYWDDRTDVLWVVGGGDPFLVSEELSVLAKALAQVLPSTVVGIGLDGSLFQRDLDPPGSGQSANPYDAVPSAIAANFNTIHLTRVNGQLASAELQTPMTPMARRFEPQVGAQNERINIGRQTDNAEQYFAELLAVFLADEGISIGSKVIFGRLPEQLRQQPVWVHRQSRTLGEIMQLMLKYSTNFIANQVMLALVAEERQEPVSFSDVRTYLQQKLQRQFSWKRFKLVDGAGLSPENRLSSSQLVELLAVFEPWRNLLPEVRPGVIAKTGTLTNVRTLSGYALVDGLWQRFAIMINGKGASSNLIERVAEELVTDRVN